MWMSFWHVCQQLIVGNNMSSHCKSWQYGLSLAWGTDQRPTSIKFFCWSKKDTYWRTYGCIWMKIGCVSQQTIVNQQYEQPPIKDRRLTRGVIGSLQFLQQSTLCPCPPTLGASEQALFRHFQSISQSVFFVFSVIFIHIFIHFWQLPVLTTKQIVML